MYINFVQKLSKLIIDPLIYYIIHLLKYCVLLHYYIFANANIFYPLPTAFLYVKASAYPHKNE